MLFLSLCFPTLFLFQRLPLLSALHSGMSLPGWFSQSFWDRLFRLWRSLLFFLHSYFANGINLQSQLTNRNSRYVTVWNDVGNRKKNIYNKITYMRTFCFRLKSKFCHFFFLSEWHANASKQKISIRDVNRHKSDAEQRNSVHKFP